VTVALACILFDGGMNIGWARFRSAAAPIAVVGVLGTFLTVFAGALPVHFAFGLAWDLSLLVATAVAPTDRRWCSPSLASGRSPVAAASS
jgi:cell volume regulation protein A